MIGLVRTLRWVVLLTAAALASTPTGAAQGVLYSGSLQAATGDYLFTERTNSVYFNNGLTFASDRLRVSLSLPVIVQSTPWVTASAAGTVGLPTGGPHSGSVGTSRGQGRTDRDPIQLADTASVATVGAGDPSLFVSARVVRETTTWPTVRLIGSIKAPLADASAGFSTGGWDTSLGLSLSKAVGMWFIAADLAAWRFGDLDDLELQDALGYSASLGRAFEGGRFGLMATVSGFTEVIDGVAPPVQVGLGANVRISTRFALSANAALGLTEASPDLAGGLGWHLTL